MCPLPLLAAAVAASRTPRRLLGRGLAAAMSAAGRLKSVDYEVFGRVQGVCFRMYTEGEAKKIGVVGWVKNTSKGTVTGQVQGPEEKVNSIGPSAGWLHLRREPQEHPEKRDPRPRESGTRQDSCPQKFYKASCHKGPWWLGQSSWIPVSQGPPRRWCPLQKGHLEDGQLKVPRSAPIRAALLSSLPCIRVLPKTSEKNSSSKKQKQTTRQH
ncbi:acylphosphatase-2 isoform X1 [Mirounga leonina]|uniref:acylphosphatase-2 isoform X1 n=1 Tax=Mirounga leonina TaxID=9715 RepID=UPI00156BF643|nr:acylphosphatase-2 isoform X1 [Mirounga leonina]